MKKNKSKISPSSESRRDFIKYSLATAYFTASGGFVSAEQEHSLILPPKTSRPKPGKVPKVNIQSINGDPQLFINGVPQSRMMGRLSCPGGFAPEKMEQYLGSGINVFLTDVDIECTLGWDGEYTYDYRFYEHHLDKILEVNPDIYLIIYVGCAGSAPYKWNRKHEDQLPLLSNGDRLRIPSLASERWLEDSCNALTRFVQYWQNSSYAGHIIGYNLIQWSNEWHTPTTRNHPPLDDYSQPMLEKFRQWLRNHYQNDQALLRKSWKDLSVSFSNATIPAEEKRLQQQGLLNGFADKDSQVTDYLRCFRDVRTNFIIRQCQAVKEASAEPTLTCLSRLGEKEMLESPWVDVHHGPYHYRDRKIAHISGYAKATYWVRNKLHIDQIDTGTHVMPKTGGQGLGVGSIWPGPFRLTNTPEESLQILKRDVAFSIALNGTLYWNEGGPGWMFPILSHGVTTWGKFWYDTPEIKNLIKQLKQVVDENQLCVAKSVTQVAVITSDEMGNYLPANSHLERLFNRISSSMTMIALSGVPYDAYSLEDFEQIKSSYKVYIFPNALFVPQGLRKTITSKLAADKATAVWLYGPGYADEYKADLNMMKELTGFEFNMEEKPSLVQVDFTTRSHRLLQGLSDVDGFGSARIYPTNVSDVSLTEVGPFLDTEAIELPATFWCNSAGVDVLGHLKGSNKPGIALKNHQGFRSIWMAAPQPPMQLLRNIFEQAGVHVYSNNGDQVFINSRFAGLYAITSGEKEVVLPRNMKVREALDGEIVAQNTSRIRFTARAGDTHLYVLE